MEQKKLQDLIAKLNPDQFRAVMHQDKNNLLIFAGAGSGKTKVITLRVAWLLLNGKVKPEQLLLCTFTRKAAAEMRHRLENLVGKKMAERINIGTMHSICAKMLKLKQDQLVDDAKRTTIINQLFKAELLKEYPEHEVKWVLAEISSCISGFKNKMITPKDAQGKWADEYRAYHKHMVSVDLLDFDDLIFRWVYIMSKPEHALALKVHIHDRFKFVFVDEFQDTNYAQSQFVDLVSGGAQLCIVGDDDQAIYGWRGAKVSLIQEYARKHPGAKVIQLQQNYRSWQTLLDAAHAPISRTNRAKDGSMISDKSQKQGHDGQLITVQRCANCRVEASWIADKIVSSHEDGVSYNHNVVLCRTNMQKEKIRLALDAVGVPHMDSDESLYNRPEIVHILDILNASDPELDATNIVRDIVMHSGHDMTKDNETTRAIKAFVGIVEAHGENIHGLLTAISRQELDDPTIVSDKVVISTVHGVKGLEYQIVFLTGMEDGVFPTKSALKDAHGWVMDEERRLLYVAMTRAMEKLYITYCDKRERDGVMEVMQPSMFLSDFHPRTLDVPEPILDELEIKEGLLVNSVQDVHTDFVPSEGCRVYHPEKGNGLVLKIRKPFADVRFSLRTETVLLQSLKEEQVNAVDITTTTQTDNVVIVN